jgi:hypothetical protein
MDFIRKIVLQALLIICVLYGCRTESYAGQNDTCTLSGTDTVIAGSTASFTLSTCSATNWTTSCGTITSQGAGVVTIYFADASCGSSVITASGNGSSIASKTIIVIPDPVINAGTISDSLQAVNFNTSPGVLIAPGATGGACGGTYSYHWLISTDSLNFLPITGANQLNYQPGPLTATTYFKRQASCTDSTAAFMTNTAVITVYPRITIGNINPPSQSVNYDSSATPLSIDSVSGGSGGYIYQWQSSPDGISFSNISGASTSSYSPGNPALTTYYRLGVVSNTDTTFSGAAILQVFPQLQAGSLSPSSQTVAYDSMPSVMNIAGTGGGSGSYSYQWYSSSDSVNWVPIAGVTTATYSPGGLTATTWYQVIVSSNGVASGSAVAVVYVGPAPPTGMAWPSQNNRQNMLAWAFENLTMNNKNRQL